ncbi:MAG: excinuclease ABC subunit UvrA [Flavobacteriales bacterium]
MADQIGRHFIEIYGARVHNLKGIDVDIPRDKLVVITGLSGSGKSSLAFDTLYAEGQRRYIETFSAYARQFLGSLDRPDVDKIDGLSPVIAIEQKTTSRNPRSTVGTITEIYDFLRLLYARIGEAYSPVTGEKMVSYSEAQIQNLIAESYDGQSIRILAPVVRGRQGHYRERFESIVRQGFVKVRVDGTIAEIKRGMKLNRYQRHDIEIVIDQIAVDAHAQKRLKRAIGSALQHGEGTLMILEKDSGEPRYFSRHLMCPSSGLSYPTPEPNHFSFNSPKGACPTCNGLGFIHRIDEKKIMPNPNLSIKRGGIAPIGEEKNTWIFRQLYAIGLRYGFTLRTPIKDIPEKGMDVILNGSREKFSVPSPALGMIKSYTIDFEGIKNFIQKQYSENTSTALKRWAKAYMDPISCPECGGMRLKPESLSCQIDGKNIGALADLYIDELLDWLQSLPEKLSERRRQIASEIRKELITRARFLCDVGLAYLTLNRPVKSLSGGEAQRIRLATQIGSQLTHVLYILDEPSIGLHQRDNDRLVQSLKQLRDIGNSVIVVEHDKDIIRSADYVIDMGPGAGKHGGEVVAMGTPQSIEKGQGLTAAYLSGKKKIEIPKKRRKGNGHCIEITGARGHNLRDVDLRIPLGTLTVVSGVSGSGKSSLIDETLYRIANQQLYRAVTPPLPYRSAKGIEHIDKVIDIDQSPIGQTPRSNPATYTGVFDAIRSLFAQLPESKVRGYRPGRFSFNVKGGRCETCQGAGIRVIEMNFLPDVQVPCAACGGKRFSRETLEVRYRGHSISDVLDMTIREAVDFFKTIPKIHRKIKTLQAVGLGYLTLGQQRTTLSGGEAQRVKLAAELSKKSTGKTLYILDEPTTGLHFEDVDALIRVLQKLVDLGNTVVVIEHNLDVLKVADYLVDMGPEGGKDGGQITATGKPEEVMAVKNSHTAPYLKRELLY